MRFGLVIEQLDVDEPLPELIRLTSTAEGFGFDLVWLPESRDGMPSSAVAAAALAPHTRSIRVGIGLEAGTHPVYLAEEAVVADLCLSGRLVLGVGSPDLDLMVETIDVLLAALAPRPFRHEGHRWAIPARLPDNVVNRAERIRVTPACAQLEPPIWLTGPHAPRVASEYCLTFVGARDESTEELADHWRFAESRLGRAAGRLRRVAERGLHPDVNGSIDADAVTQQLRADQRSWGLDVVLLRLPAGTSLKARLRCLEQLASLVIPRVQLDRLPPGLEDYWKQRQEST